jgi:hypothetical protein
MPFKPFVLGYFVQKSVLHKNTPTSVFECAKPLRFRIRALLSEGARDVRFEQVVVG